MAKNQFLNWENVKKTARNAISQKINLFDVMCFFAWTLFNFLAHYVIHISVVENPNCSLNLGYYYCLLSSLKTQHRKKPQPVFCVNRSHYFKAAGFLPMVGSLSLSTSDLSFTSLGEEDLGMSLTMI